MNTPTMKDVKDYFTKDSTVPVNSSEFSAFWKSLSDDDKEYYKNAAHALLNA